MRVEKVSFGNMIWLTTEEQHKADVIETIKKLKETGRVVIFISGCEDVQQVIHKVMNKRTINTCLGEKL